MECSANDNPVAPLLKNLVDHYQQPVHEVKEELPYFDDQATEKESIKSPVIRSLIEQLLQIQLQEDRDIVVEIFLMYDVLVRPALIVQDHIASTGTIILNDVKSSGTSVLKHYDLLLHEYMVTAIQRRPDARSSALTEAQTSILETSSRLGDVLKTISCDITLMTAIPDKPQSLSPYIVSNVILTTLLHLQTMLVDYCSSSDIPLPTTDVRRCVVSLLAFNMSSLSPLSIDASIEPSLCKVYRYWSYPPNEECKNVQIKGLDWSTIALEGSFWDDSIQGASSRAARILWHQLARTHGIFEETDVFFDVQKHVLQTLGMLDVSKAVRAHFFGRDMPTAEPPSKQMTHLHLGFNTPYTPPSDVAIRPYQRVPARLHAVLQFISLVDGFDIDMYDELLPVCYEMLNASNDTITVMGAVAVYHLLQLKGSARSAWQPAAISNLEGLVNQAVKVCDKSNHFAILGLVQRTLLKDYIADEHVGQARRKTTAWWLWKLDRNQHRLTDGTVWGLLLGGVVPLLHQHAQFGNADASELGRMGLAAMLPLLRAGGRNEMEREVSILALIGLSNLMVAAYPIMPHHGGKIIAELLGALGKCESLLLEKVLRHVAVLAVIVCGDRAAKLLNEISDSNKYESFLIDIAHDVQSRAANWNGS
jgi:hypothetical protein